ncbi:hypothetical protein NADFUDRAFT_81155 [Nadsonia fulvescens var. elongata DSM 6958]|uniref:Cora-domain-containing protein n=1 Tax=Nadsonia fulvescens var. elongata DSM 6958 TaxID=857566 RepID=A0A1E3PS56_9ASCO|nr:hypothetical protein NADFUDRAFT_81155 [Nadsonia fulvescens var. elongata DSM 6958]
MGKNEDSRNSCTRINAAVSSGSQPSQGDQNYTTGSTVNPERISPTATSSGVIIGGGSGAGLDQSNSLRSQALISSHHSQSYPNHECQPSRPSPLNSRSHLGHTTAARRSFYVFDSGDPNLPNLPTDFLEEHAVGSTSEDSWGSSDSDSSSSSEDWDDRTTVFSSYRERRRDREVEKGREKDRKRLSEQLPRFRTDNIGPAGAGSLQVSTRKNDRSDRSSNPQYLHHQTNPVQGYNPSSPGSTCWPPPPPPPPPVSSTSTVVINASPNLAPGGLPTNFIPSQNDIQSKTALGTEEPSVGVISSQMVGLPNTSSSTFLNDSNYSSQSGELNAVPNLTNSYEDIGDKILDPLERPGSNQPTITGNVSANTDHSSDEYINGILGNNDPNSQATDSPVKFSQFNTTLHDESSTDMSDMAGPKEPISNGNGLTKDTRTPHRDQYSLRDPIQQKVGNSANNIEGLKGMTYKKRREKSRRKYSSSGVTATAARRRAGWEPGVDIRTTDVILQSIGSSVTIVDYSADRYKVVHTDVYPSPENEEEELNSRNKDFIKALDSKPSWGKVRWINVNGLSWETISAISQKYQLHRLAIEDMVDIPQRTKADQYPTHTFCCFPLHKLIHYKPPSFPTSHIIPFFGRRNIRKQNKKNETEKSYNSNPADDLNLHRTKSRSGSITSIASEKFCRCGFEEKHNKRTFFDNDETSLSYVLSRTNMDTIYDWTNPILSHKKSQYLASRRPLSSQHRAVGIEQVSLFLTNQNTVISFFEHSAGDIETPILARISSESTILRESCDPSILLQAIIDSCVDLIYPIIASYRNRIAEQEIDVLTNPTMAHTQDLHLLEGELAMLKRTINPITSLVTSLREHHSKTEEKLSTALISELAKVYLADVGDHTQAYTDDLDIMRSNTKNMIDIIFNTISIQSNDSVKQLSIVTVIFLPLSFLTGYFGMNFEDFSAIKGSVNLYWEIAMPVCFAIIALVMWPYVQVYFNKVKSRLRSIAANKEKKEKKKLRRKSRRNSVSEHAGII